MSAWTVIAHTELPSTQAVVFTSIPATYTDLVILLSARGDEDTLDIFFNNSDTNFSGRALQGSNGSAGSFTRSDNFVGYVNNTSMTANTFSNTMIYIPNYASSNNKSFSVDTVNENNSTSASMNIFAGLWSQTAAINEIKLQNLGGSGFVQYSSATLYGITKGSSGGVSVS
jgi:hypothetical protein